MRKKSMCKKSMCKKSIRKKPTREKTMRKKSMCKKSIRKKPTREKTMRKKSMCKKSMCKKSMYKKNNKKKSLLRVVNKTKRKRIIQKGGEPDDEGDEIPECRRRTDGTSSKARKRPRSPNTCGDHMGVANKAKSKTGAGESCGIGLSMSFIPGSDGDIEEKMDQAVKAANSQPPHVVHGWLTGDKNSCRKIPVTFKSKPVKERWEVSLPGLSRAWTSKEPPLSIPGNLPQ